MAETGNPDVEFVLLDYESQDGLGDWVRASLGDEIASGRLVYARYEPAPHFRMAHAKNMAHRIASGDVLVNVDGDNFIAKDFSLWLRTLYSRSPDALASPRDISVTGFLRQRVFNKLVNLPRPVDGLCGRIAVSRAAFFAVGGYDEAIAGWGSDDIDFMLRVRDAGTSLAVIPAELWGGTIPHDNVARIENMTSEARKLSASRLGKPLLKEIADRIRQITSRHDRIANAGAGFGCGHVRVNWTTGIELAADAAR
jgi:hypothetical protein